MQTFEYVLERVTNRGLPRMLGGSRTWTTIVVAAITLRTIRRMRRTSGEPLYRTVIQPGDQFEIVTRAALNQGRPGNTHGGRYPGGP